MDKHKVDIDDTNISLDLSDATQAVKENRFQDAILLLERILKDQPDNIDALYLWLFQVDTLRNLINLKVTSWIYYQMLLIWVVLIRNMDI